MIMKKKQSVWAFGIVLVCLILSSGSVFGELMAFWNFGADTDSYTLEATKDNFLVTEPVLFVSGGDLDGNGKGGLAYTDSEGQFHAAGRAVAWDDIRINNGQDAEWVLAIDTRGWKDLKIRWDYRSEEAVDFDLQYRTSLTGEWVQFVTNKPLIADDLWNELSCDLSSAAVLNNQPTLEIRLEGIENRGNNKYRFDNLELTGTPDPEFTPNVAPSVNAGADITIDWPGQTAQLAAVVTDDGKPDPPGKVTGMWIVTSGAGSAIFTPSKLSLNATVSFNKPGVYVLGLQVDDGELVAYDEMTITAVSEAIYVDSTAQGANDGSSWIDAFLDLQDAVAVAENTNNIWVAEGVYFPDVPFGSNRATFELKNGVSLYGGFPPGGGTWEQRKVSDYETILSGDLNRNDTLGGNMENLHLEPSRSENCFHVVTALGVNETTVLNGFTITAGRAGGDDIDDNGGGMLNVFADPTIENCTFTLNSAAEKGGGIYNQRSNSPLTGCKFGNNVALQGGAIYNHFNELTLYSCNITTNIALDSGGGIYNYFSNISMWGGLFGGNRTILGNGGGMFNYDTELTAISFQFTSNTANSDGGGMSNHQGCNINLTDCRFTNNRSGDDGGGMDNNSQIEAVLTNCIFISNEASDNGGGIYNRSNSNPALIACRFERNTTGNKGGGVFLRYGCNPTLTDTLLVANQAFSGSGLYIDGSGTARILGTNILESNDWKGLACEITGTGALRLAGNVTMFADNVELSCNLIGTGRVKVSPGQELTIKNTAVIDLSDSTNPQIKGIIECDGLLRLTDDVIIKNTYIKINSARLLDDVEIFNSVIVAEESENGTPFGQFFVEERVRIVNNDIHADGDRYLDFNPTLFEGEIAANRLFVTISEGQNDTRGGLLECRGADGLITGNFDEGEFFRHVSNGSIPLFTPTSWTIEQLTLLPGAKVNLTNRFDFQEPYDEGGENEVMYVNKLVMGAGSVLNTAFNRFYYKDGMEIDQTAKVMKVPLLGFSLNNIAFDSNMEFVTRIRHNNGESLGHPREHVARVIDDPLDPDGIMKMCVLSEKDPNSPAFGEVISARAKGLFSKAGPDENEVLILFEYLFDTSDPDVELVVYLSDRIRLLDHGDNERDKDYLEVARLKPPLQGQPGSEGSGRFARFQQYAPVEYLKFIKGVRVELELTGPEGACIRINNLDPQVHCTAIPCKDITWDNFVDEVDLLTVIGEIGTSSELTSEGNSRACLEGPFSNDGSVDWFDVEGWCWILGLDDTEDNGTLCNIPVTSYASAPPPLKSLESKMAAESYFFEYGGHILVSGKRGTSTKAAKGQDRLYVYDSQGQFVDYFEPAYPKANGKIITDSDNVIRQLNLIEGLIGISDSNSVIPPAIVGVARDPRYGTDARISIGLQSNGENVSGRPISDVAFDSQGYAYVTPVVVDPNTSSVAIDPNFVKTYFCTAKLEITENPDTPWRIVRLYDDEDAGAEGDIRELNALREIEIDGHGNLYVINAHSLNESDILWKYDAATGQMKKRLNLTGPDSPDIPAPAAMYLSKTTNMLYLSSSRNEKEGTTAEIYEFSTADLSYIRTITINGMGHITSIAEVGEAGKLAVSGFVMRDIPEFDPDDPYNPDNYVNPNTDPFYHPCLAIVTPLSDTADAIALAPLGTDENNDLALPMSIVWMGQISNNCRIEDIDCNGRIDSQDFAILSSQWLNTGTDLTADIAPQPDVDGTVDILDLAAFVEQFLKPDENYM